MLPNSVLLTHSIMEYLRSLMEPNFFFFLLHLMISSHRNKQSDGGGYPKASSRRVSGTGGGKTGASSYPALLCSLRYQRGLIISQRHRWNTFSTALVYWGVCLKFKMSSFLYQRNFPRGKNCNSDRELGEKEKKTDKGGGGGACVSGAFYEA